MSYAQSKSFYQIPNMLFEFAPHIQAGLASGIYQQVFSNGVPIGAVRWAAGTPNAGQVAAHAIGMAANNGPMAPMVAVAKVAMNGMQMSQIQTGIKTLQASVGILQSTAMIGVGLSAVGVGLAAINLYQTIKLKKAVERLEVKVENGFIDLKQALNDQGAEIIQQIQQVSQDIKFEQNRLVLVKAYGRFTQALKSLQDAEKMTNIDRRNSQIDMAKGMLSEALADYKNSEILKDPCTAVQFRRQECVWAIEQALIMIYQLQEEYNLVQDKIGELKTTIREDCLQIIEKCESPDELDFLFPEITRIKNHDLIVLEAWKNQVNWMKSLPEQERKMLASSDLEGGSALENYQGQGEIVEPEEIQFYENLKPKSHFSSLALQLQFMMAPDLRQNYEDYISEQAQSVGYKALALNIQKASDMTVANLCHYFYLRDEELEDEELEATPA